MVTGTFILTDSIKGAFNGIFTEIYSGTDAVISGKSAFDLSEPRLPRPPAVRRVAARRRFAHSPTSPTRSAASAAIANLVGKNGKVIAFGGAPHLGFSVDPTRPAVQHARARRRHVAAGRRGRDRQVDGREEALPGRPDDRRRGRGARSQRMRISGLVKFGWCVDPRRGDARRLRPADRPAPLQQAGKARPDRRRREVRRARHRADQADPGILPPGTPGADRRGAGGRGREGHEHFISFLQNFLLAFGGSPSSSALRDRELALDHDRPADPRVCDPADARRNAPPGARSVFVEALVIGALASVIGLLLGFALAKGLFKLFDAVGFTLPNNGLLFETRTIVVSLLVGIARHVARQPPSRAPRDPRAADRGRARGRDPAAGRFARYRTLGSCDLRCSGSPRSPTACSAAASAPRRSSSAWGSARADLLRRRAPLGADRAPARERPRLAGDALRRRPGVARARQRAAQPAAHRLHRLGADDRSRARHARRRPRGRDHVELQRRRERSGRTATRSRPRTTSRRSRSRPATRRRRRRASRRSRTCAAATRRSSARRSRRPAVNPQAGRSSSSTGSTARRA